MSGSEAKGPRLWGEWKAEFHPSGTCLVVLADRDNSRPHLYVFADPVPGDKRQCQRNRKRMCREIAAWLNGGDRPLWLDDFVRTSPVGLEAVAGAMILAAGPWLRRAGSSAQWRQDTSPTAQRDRDRLLEALVGPA